jgi:hypothetical protein
MQKEGQLTLRDLKQCKLSGNFFNILFNLNKFVAFETRDPFLIRQVSAAFSCPHGFLLAMCFVDEVCGNVSLA